jgi:RNA polymerase sigma factor (sigma-70 family)
VIWVPRRPTVLVRALTEAESARLEAYYRAHADALHGYACQLTGGDVARAQDLVQDTFLRIAERFALFDEGREFLPFARRVMRNLWIDQGRKRVVATVRLWEER